MLYYLHLLLLAPFYSLVSILLRRDQDREILLLRQQLLILSRKLRRKAAYGRLEKLALLLAGLRLWRLAKAFLPTASVRLSAMSSIRPRAGALAL